MKEITPKPKAFLCRRYSRKLGAALCERFDLQSMRNPQESVEWRDAFHAVLQVAGQDRVRELMDMLSALARDPAIGWQPA